MSLLINSVGRLGRPLVVASFALLLCSCEQIGSISDVEHISRAKDFEARGDHRAAIIELKSVLQKNPKNAEARWWLGKSFIAQGLGAEAERELVVAESLGVEHDRIAPDLGLALLTQRAYGRVLNEINPTAETPAAEAATMLAIRGEAQLQLGRIGDAKASYEKSLAIQPGNFKGLLGNAQIALIARKPDEAASLIEQVLRNSPTDLSGLMAKAGLLSYLAKPDEAKAAYGKVLATYPNNVEALIKLSYLNIVDNKFEEAGKQIREIRRVDGANEFASYLQALIEFKKQNYPAARDLVQRVVAAAPGYIPAVLLAGAVEFALGSDGQAEKYLRQVLLAAPRTLWARKLLVAALTRSKQYAQAVEAMQPALKQAPNDVDILKLAGITYAQNKDYAKATEVFEKAAALDPSNAAIKTSLGMSRLASGDMTRAVSDLEKAIQIDTTDSQAAMLLIVSHLSRQEYDQASKAVEVLEKSQPKSPLTYNFKAAVLIGRKDFAAASIALEKALSLDPTYIPAATNLARLDLLQKHPDAAKGRFRAVLEKDKGNLGALLALAALSNNTGARPAEVLALLEQARAANPKAYQPPMMIARYLAQSDPKKAIVAARDAFALSPDDPDVLDVLGQAQLAAGERSGALDTYTKLAELKPNSPIALMRLGSVLIDNGNQAGAARVLKKAIELKPDLVDAQFALAGLELGAGRAAEAIKVAQRVQKQSPASPAGYVLEADVLMTTKSYLKAAALYEKAFAIQKSGALVTRIHTAYLLAGKIGEADTRLQQWIAANPDDLVSRSYLAAYALKTRQYKTAIAQQEFIISKEPQNVAALNDLAWLYGQVKDPRALDTAARAYDLNSSEAAVADTYGWMLVEQGQTQKGLGILRTAAAAAPEVPEIRLHVAQALLKSGDKAKAKIELERLVNSRGKSPQQAEAAALLGRIDE